MCVGCGDGCGVRVVDDDMCVPYVSEVLLSTTHPLGSCPIGIDKLEDRLETTAPESAINRV